LHSWRFYSAATLFSYWIWIQTPSCILLVPWNQVLKVWIRISHHRYVMPTLQMSSLLSLAYPVIYAWQYDMPTLLAYQNVTPCIFDLFCWFPAFKLKNWTFQCASAVDNLAAYYFNNITMGEVPTSPTAINLARHIADCPNLFPEVSQAILYYSTPL
jgi:hypothetical protein